ncbi:MAG: complex I subunit 1 family protein [Candidatus Obscuribacterales bacterium]
MGNAAEIFKFVRLSAFWLSVIFIPVWLVAWAVGIFIPNFIIKDPSNILFDLCQALVPIIAVLVFIPINAMFMVLFERRGLALFTVRSGPNRAGFDGLFQTAADAVKLLFKEDITPRGADIAMFTLAPITFFAPSVFAAIPLLAAVTNDHPLFHIVNLPTGIFYVLAASSVPVVGIVMGGWASNNKYSLVGGLRSAAQAISYEIPLVLSLISICMMAKSLDVVQIANQQSGGILSWNIFGGGALRGIDKFIALNLTGNTIEAKTILDAAYPAGLLSYVAAAALIVCTVIMFALYLTGACAEINRIPFDLPEAESELVSGYNTEYSGIKFAIFFLAEFTNLFIVSSIAVVMFMGGGGNPIPSWLLDPWWGSFSNSVGPIFDLVTSKGVMLVDEHTFFPALWVIAKTYAFVFFAVLIRGTLPRFRIDQLMDFGWKRLIPLSLIVFLVMAFARVLVNVHLVMPAGGAP